MSGLTLNGVTEVSPFLEYARGTSFSLGISVNPSFGIGSAASIPAPGASTGAPLGSDD